MRPDRPSAAIARKQLVVVAHGVASSQCHRVGAAPTEAGCLLPFDWQGDDAAAQVVAHLPTAALRDLGLEVDRRSVVLRSPGCSDEQTVRQVARRPAGPAHVTIVDLRQPLTAAVASGPDSHGYALACQQFGEHLGELLRSFPAAPPALWLVSLGAPVATSRNLDIARLLGGLLGRPLAARLRLRVEPDAALVASDSRRCLDLLLDRLPHTELADAVVEDLGMGRLRWLAPAGVAFGRRPVCARAAHPDEAVAAVLTPVAPRTIERLDPVGVACRCAMAVAALAPRQLEQAAPVGGERANRLEGAPDLLPSLRAVAEGAGAEDVVAADLAAEDFVVEDWEPAVEPRRDRGAPR